MVTNPFMTGTVDTSAPGSPSTAATPANPMMNISQASQSTSQGTGAPVSLQTPQSDYQLQLAQEIANAGQNQYGWAQDQYGYLQGIANEAIPQYLQGAGASNQLAQQQLAQYEGMYLPAQAQFNQLAQTWASPARTAVNMGQAEADATQNANASWNNTRQQLQSMGIDPSSGEYAGLQAAANTAAGASAAGAGNQARQATEQQGLGLQEQNINFGQTMPASALNAVNAGYAGQAGAINTGQSTVNTGTNAFQGANQFYNTAMGVNPAAGGSGQNTQNTSASTGAGYTAKPPFFSSTSSPAAAKLAQGGLVEPADSYRRGGKVKRPHGGGRGMGGGGQGDPVAPHTPGVAPGSFGGGPGYNSFLQSDDQLRRATGGATSPSPASTLSGAVNHPTPGDTQWGQAASQAPPPPPSSVSNNAGSGDPNTTLAGDGGGISQGGLPMQPHGYRGRPHPPHPYQVNGLPDASTGGHVPYDISPSHGHTTDDVVANLNAGEFVLPRRTAHHLGHKFLYDLIAKSDKEMGMHPQPVGGKPVKPGSGADKARSSAESQNFLGGGAI